MRKKFNVKLEPKDVPSCQVSVPGLLRFAVDLAAAILFKFFCSMILVVLFKTVHKATKNMNIICETFETCSYSGKFLLGT